MTLSSQQRTSWPLMCTRTGMLNDSFSSFPPWGFLSIIPAGLRSMRTQSMAEAVDSVFYCLLLTRMSHKLCAINSVIGTASRSPGGKKETSAHTKENGRFQGTFPTNEKDYTRSLIYACKVYCFFPSVPACNFVISAFTSNFPSTGLFAVVLFCLFFMVVSAHTIRVGFL